ncbi:MAG TPA: hypothetical protein VG797_06900 [Phycisphaerales bacterium]|nr:hypothetical protein [Phycisphaerales bacterium]
MNNAGVSSRIAFTLVEVIAALAVTAVLVAISVPAVRSVRLTADNALALTRIAQSSQLIHAHAAERHGVFPLGELDPLHTDGHGPTTTVSLPGGASVRFGWFGHAGMWNVVLRSWGEPLTPVWFASGEFHDPVLDAMRPSDFALTHAALAEPRYWTPGEAQSAGDWRAMPISRTRCPSTKAMLAERDDSLLQRLRPSGGAEAIPFLPRPVAFIDGHSSLEPSSRARPAVANSLTGMQATPFVTTERGLEGSDL